jgi:hypothetical protein
LSAFSQLSGSSQRQKTVDAPADRTKRSQISDFWSRAGSLAAAPGPGTAPAFRARMTHRNVENVIGRLATDPALRRRFTEDPAGILRELRDQGCELTLVEIEALASTDADAIRSFADTLDRRIRRAVKEEGPYEN